MTIERTSARRDQSFSPCFVGLARNRRRRDCRDSASIGLATSATAPSPSPPELRGRGRHLPHPNWRKTVWGSGKWPAVLAENRRRGTFAASSAPAGSAAPRLATCALSRPRRKLCGSGREQRAGFRPAADPQEYRFSRQQRRRRALSAIEGANEYNSPSDRPPDWAPRASRFFKVVHDTVMADRRLRGVPWSRLDLGRLDERLCGDRRSRSERG